MERLIDTISTRYNLDQDAAQEFVTHFTPLDITKGALIVTAGCFNDNFYLIEDGIIRAFMPADNGEQTLWFGYRGQAFFDVWCYHWHRPSRIAIEAVTPAQIRYISKLTLESLCDRSNTISNVVRKIFEGHAAEAEDSITSLITCDNGLERYLSILRRHPELLQYVPLKKLASYLQLAPQSLSRIRSQIR